PEVVVWTVDTECPDTTFVVLPEVVTHLTSTVFVVEGGPDAAAFEYALDPADTAVVADADADGSDASSGSTTSGDAGAGHEIRVRAVDSAGNADPSPATYSWIVD
ncbi:unnamed protein product, partial [Scytosiphon promiscuus]